MNLKQKWIGILIIMGASISYGQTFVKPGATGNGSSWANAFGRIQEAINATSSGGSIWIAEGVYYPQYTSSGSGPNHTERLNTFYIDKNIKLYGGFNGTESMLTQRDIKRHVTILSGDINVPDVSIDNVYHVMVIDGRTSSINNSCVIDGIQIEYGYADGPSFPEDVAGGIYVIGEGTGAQANPTIHNCVLRFNYSRGWAGALYIDGSENGQCDPKISQSLFYQNFARYGGAVYSFGLEGQCVPSFQNCLFYGNQSEYGGGAMRNFGDGLTGIIENCIFWNNDDEITNVANGTTCTINYSIYDDGNSNGTVQLPLGASGSHNSDYYPQFIDSAGQNFRLQNSSPALDNGNSAPIGWTLDYDQQSRKNSTIDIGPYENPWINCPLEIIIMDPYYQPLKGPYQAANQIILQDVTMAENLVLKAPEVQLFGVFESVQSIDINPIGCPNE